VVKIDTKKIIIYGIVILLIGMLAGYYICSRRSVSTASQSAAAVTSGLDNIGQQQSAATTAVNGASGTISDAQGTANSITGDISNAQESADSIADGLNNAQGTVDDLTAGTTASQNLSTASADIIARDKKILVGLSKVSQ
jgi:peptidoglycan hydrolase CwlO-like protein